jgi:rRNA maturation RNase YbeY
MEQSRRRSSSAQWGEITVELTDDASIADVNSDVFGRNYATDVIALRYDPIPGVDTTASAELFVNVQRAIEHVCRGTWNTSQELALYIAHGCDHLSGATDDTDEGRSQMRDRELRWLRKAKSLGLLEGILGPN